MAEMGVPWKTALISHILINEWGININHGNQYTEFQSKNQEFRTITLRRLKGSWGPGFVANPLYPPIVWALWSHKMEPSLQGYFEETSLNPTENQLETAYKIFELWLLKFENAYTIQEWAKKNHPNFHSELPDHFKPLKPKFDDLPKLLTTRVL